MPQAKTTKSKLDFQDIELIAGNIKDQEMKDTMAQEEERKEKQIRKRKRLESKTSVLNN